MLQAVGLLAESLGHRGLTRFCAALGTISLVVLVLFGKRAGPVVTPSLAVD